MDLDNTEGDLDRLSGVQGSPYPIVEGDVDHREAFRARHVAGCRFPQDCAPNTLTLSGIFPDGEADVDAPSSYRFEAIDRHVTAARAAGAEVLWQSSYDVAGTDAWLGMNLGGRPPADLDRWSRVVTRCLEHWNNGWAAGLERAIRHVEFVNEPDGLGGFRGPDRRRLIPAFEGFLRTVEAYNRAHPETPVTAVGPGVPFSFPDWSTYEPQLERLLSSLRASGTPLPIFSFHTYGSDVSPRANAALALALRALLDGHGFGETELWNTEWQGGGFLRQHLGVTARTERRASDRERGLFAAGIATYALSCKARWQGVVRGSYYYRANARAYPPGPRYRRQRSSPSRGAMFPPSGEVSPLSLQEELTYVIASEAPLRCAAEWEDDGELTVLAARAREAGSAAVLLCNLSPRPRAIALRVRGSWPSEQVSVARTTIEPATTELTREPMGRRAQAGSSLAVTATVPALSSTLLHLSAVGA